MQAIIVQTGIDTYSITHEDAGSTLYSPVTIALPPGGDPDAAATELLDNYQQRGDPTAYPVTAAELLEMTRAGKIKAIKDEAIRRISLQVPALNSYDMVAFMAELWPALDTAALGVPMTAAKDIYIYAKTKITQVQSATQAQLNAYNPATDPNWPA